MIIEKAVGVATDALEHPKKFHAFFGISIRNNYFSSQIMCEYFEWLSQQFDSVTIFLMDDPDQYNYIAFNKDSPEVALKKARDMATHKKKNFTKLLTKLKIENIKIVMYQDFIQEKKYIDTLDCISRYVKTNSKLKKVLLDVMDSSIGGKIKDLVKANNISPEEVTEMKKILLQYLIEELATLVYFTESGTPIEIDPYEEFYPKRLLYEGFAPELAEELHLTNRGHIYAHPENHPYKKFRAEPEANAKEADAQHVN